MKSAIFIRKDELFAKIWSDLEDEATFLEKRPIVHVICRSKYTLKRTLDNIKLRSKQTKGEKSDSLDNSTIRLRSDSSSLVGKSLEYNKSVCFLCEKERDSYGVWTLIAIATPDGRERAIHKKAKDINDEVMLFKIKGHGETCVDMVANNFHYHRSRYMNKRTLNDKEISSDSNQHDAVFSLLVDFSHNDSHVSSTVFDEARDFFCRLYRKPEYSFSLDSLRAHLFTSTKRDLRLLPPTEDAFHQHVLRSLCQFSLYKEAAKSNPCLLSPLKFGRKLDQKGALVPVMMTKESKMAAAKLLFCKCKKGCLQKCSCAKNGTACIIACSCNGHHLKCGRLEEDSEEDDMTFQ